MSDENELLSVPVVARMAELSERDVREAIRQEVLEAQKVGASWAIRREDAEDWIDGLDAGDGDDGSDSDDGEDDDEGEDSE